MNTLRFILLAVILFFIGLVTGTLVNDPDFKIYTAVLITLCFILAMTLFLSDDED